MEQLRRPAFSGAAGSGASSAYADVFGGPPRYSRTFAARLGDYDDVFGGLSSSCSIPVLDLPPAMEAHDPPRSSGLDYFEIFGGFEGGGVPTYEELVAEEERAAAEIQFSNGRSSNETELGQQRIEIPGFHPDHTNRNDVACLEKDQITSIASHLNDSSKPLNMPYHKTSQANMEDGTNETPNTTQPRVISGFSTYMNASQPSLSVRNDVPPNMVNGDFSLNTSSNDRISDQKHRRSFSSSSSAASSKCSGNDLRINEKQLAAKDAPANTKLHSCSSSNHSTSSGDVCFSDFPYVFVSEISLSTQPVQVPPPSRPPPKLADDLEIAKMKIPANSKTELDKAILSKSIPSQKKYSVGNAPKRRAPQVPIRDSSFFFDVEVDASSAATASAAAAAMKEAMEQAQARLKSAKESMERKWDNIPSRKKLGSNEGSKFEDGKKARSAQEIKMFNQEVDQKSFLKEKKKNEFTIEERYKARGAAKVAPDHEEKERLVVSYEQDQHMVQPNKFTSSQASSKLNDTTVEWKTDNQFYELVSNERKFKVTTELSDKRSADKVLKGAINVDEERENESSVSDLSCQPERKGISLKVHETRNREGKDKISNICDREFVEEKKELPNKIPNNFVWEEKGNKLEEVSRFPQLVDDVTELCEVQETHAKEEEVKKPNIGEGVPACAETEMEMKRCIDAPNFEAACENTENESKLEAAKEVCGNDGVQLSKDSVICQPCETDKKPEIANMIDTQVEEDEIKTPYASCMWDARDKVEPTPEMNQHENYTKARDITAPECYQESGNLPKDTSLASEQHESRNERTEDASIFVKNDLKVEVTEEAKETKKNLEELQSAERGIRLREIETIEAVEWEYYEENKTNAQIELQQSAKVQTPTQASCELENSEVLTVAVRVHEKKENENTGEVHVHMNMKEKYNIFNVAQEVFRRVVNKDVEDIQVANFLGKNGKISSRNATDICPSVITEQTVPDMRIVEKDKERRIQKELEKERKLEEEREREREREKDRIAVERATREARERSLSESRERAERIAVERVTAEARQRALAEAREKAEKASAEALEKSFTEKAAREARLRTERAAVERATAEARERAVERALAEKAAADARERAEKLNAASSRDKTRKDNETEEHSRLRSKGDVGSREKQDLSHDTQYTNQRQMDSYNHGEGESALRCKARLERHQRMVERAAKALAEKNMRDVLAQREQAERNRLAEMVDAEVRRWSTGKEGNLRALLSTLQYILGPESGWHPIPLTELITAAAVKKGYRKATLCVHPDKLQQRGANIHQKYICEKVFDLLKDAWNKFNSEER